MRRDRDRYSWEEQEGVTEVQPASFLNTAEGAALKDLKYIAEESKSGWEIETSGWEKTFWGWKESRSGWEIETTGWEIETAGWEIES